MLRYCVAASLLLSPFAAPASPDSREDRLVHEYRRFAGSKDNAESLVEGLRYDRRVELTSKSGSTTQFASPAGKMGWGNVDIALGVAKATLAEHGIRKPSPAQIEAALNGGTVTTKSGAVVTLPGVLELRASGMGWGQIAQKHGFKLGEVMGEGHRHRQDKRGHRNDDRKHGHKHADRKHDHKRADWRPDRHRADWRSDRGDFHRARFDRPERPHNKFERPERPHRPERPERGHRR